MSYQSKRTKHIQSAPEATSETVPGFSGFRPLEANFLYCPNQFFDVLLPHASRGCARLVGFMLRQTLGYLDSDGNPIREQVEFSYVDLIHGANISRGAIREVLDEALKRHFVRCVRSGRAHAAGKSGRTALYALKWSDTADYIRDPKCFLGFFEGEGNRTTVPNEYFDRVLRSEPLSVAKIVGAVIRFTVGFQTKRGGRRQQTSLSYSAIQDCMGLADRHTLNEALLCALQKNYIVRIKEGFFDRTNQANSSAAVYGIRWLNSVPCEENGSKTTPSDLSAQPGLEFPERFKNHTEETTVQNTHRERFKNHTEERFKNHTSTKQLVKENLKQQHLELFREANAHDLAAAACDQSVFEILKKQGFDERTAKQLAAAGTPESIQRQVDWLPRRQPTKNSLGMLRMAIMENWPEPSTLSTASTDEDSMASVLARHAYAGVNGNAGEPVASPSKADIEASHVFTQRLLEIWPDPNRVASFGRHFGHFWRDREERSRIRSVSVAVAIRTHGDAFLRVHEASKGRHVRQAIQRTRHDHEAQARPRWLEYLREEEQRMRIQKPEAYAEFHEERARKLTQTLNSPLFKGTLGERMRQIALRTHDNEENRLVELQGFFPEEMKDFWGWDQTFNTNAFLP